MEKTHQNATVGCLWGEDYKWSLIFFFMLVFLVICNKYVLFVKLEKINVIKIKF